MPHNATSATYSIDGGSPVSFNLPGLPPNAGTTVYNQYFFTTPELPAGPHTLLVVHSGTPQLTPLTLSHLIVTNTSNPIPAPSNSAQSASNSHGGGTSIGAIVGGVVGGITAIVLVLFLLFLYRRRQKRTGQGVALMSDPRPFMAPYELSYGPSTVAVSTPPDSLPPHPASRPLIATKPRPPHAHGHSIGELSNSTFDNSWGAVPSNTGALRKQTGLAYHPPVRHAIHEDSGVRFPPRTVVVDIPPGYSAL